MASLPVLTFYQPSCVISSQEHKTQIDHICSMVLEQGKLSKLLHNRDQELKDIHHNMHSWKDETANKMADKFTDELYNQLKV